MSNRSRITDPSQQYEVTLENWETFSAGMGLITYEKDPGGNRIPVAQSPLYQKGIDAIKEKNLTWYDFVFGCTHEDEKGKLFIAQCRGIGDQTAQEFAALWESKGNFAQAAEEQKARDRRRKVKKLEELKKLEAELEAA